MRTGILSQRSIGPTNPNNVSLISERLNDYSLFAHWDFTDHSRLFLTNPIPVKQIISASNKGTNNIKLETVIQQPDINHSSTQNNYTASSFSINSQDYMYFSSPLGDTQLNTNNMTIVCVFDLGNNIHTSGSYFFNFNGEYNDEWLDHLSSYFNLYINSSSKEIIVNMSGSGKGPQAIPYTLKYSTTTTQSYAGEPNDKFNWFTIVGSADEDHLDLYLRGKKDTQTSYEGTLNHMHIGGDNNEGKINYIGTYTGSYGFIDSKIYEVIIFNQSLNTQQLYDIDWYIETKYNYGKGRIFGD